MHRFSKLLRLGSALAALGASLVAPSLAQGAMGTSTTLITTSRPDLVSVTTPGSQGGPTADFCFSKGLGVASGGSATDFLLGPYDDDNLMEADSIAQLSDTCIEATYTDPETDDFPAYTYGQVMEGAVEANEGGGANFTDSAPLNGSDTNNGTRGFTDGPDLQNVVIRQSQNQIDYVFDQAVRDFSAVPVEFLAIICSGFPGTLEECLVALEEECAGVPPELEELCDFVNGGQTRLKYIGQDGENHFSTSAEVLTASDGRERVVRAQFGTFNGLPVNSDDVTDAVIAVAEPGAVESRTEGTSPNERFAVTVPDTSGDTNDPDLVSTEIVAGGDSDLMLFTYNGQIDPPTNGAACYAIFSTGAIQEATDILVTGPNTAQLQFDDSFSDATELVVGGGDPGGCVSDANTDEPSTQGAKPAGGNIGAFAIGYTPGADAQALTINRESDQAIVRLDQKIDPDETFLEGIHLVGPNGGNITSPSQATVPTQGPGPQPLTLDFGASEIPEGTVGIRFDVDSLFTFDLDPGDSSSEEENVAQVFGAGGPALP